MWIVNDESFFDNWNKPLFIIFLFINPGLDQESRANVTADITIKSPDGKIYGEFKDVEIWQRNYIAPRNNIQLAVGNLCVRIENGEQLGTYKVEATIKDKIKNLALELKIDFTAKEE